MNAERNHGLIRDRPAPIQDTGRSRTFSCQALLQVCLSERHPVGRTTVQDVSVERELRVMHHRSVAVADEQVTALLLLQHEGEDRKSTRLNSSHVAISYA